MDLGYPEFSPPKWYGIWCPPLDCFLLVHHNLDLLQTVRSVASNKVITALVELDIDLARRNVLDNTCCTGWTVKETEGINFTMIYQKPDTIYKVDVQASCVENPQEAQELQDWFMFALDWIKRADSYVNRNRNEFFIKRVMDLPYTDVQKEIYKILLLADSQADALQQIQAVTQDLEL